MPRKNTAVLRRSTDDYGQQLLGSETGQHPPDPEDIMVLRRELFQATQSMGVFVPAVHVLNPARFRSEPPVPVAALTQLPDVCDELTPELVPSSIAAVHPVTDSTTEEDPHAICSSASVR